MDFSITDKIQFVFNFIKQTKQPITKLNQGVYRIGDIKLTENTCYIQETVFFKIEENNTLFNKVIQYIDEKKSNPS